MMAPFIYQDVYDIALRLVEYSDNGDLPGQWATYNELKSLCEEYQDTIYDHPFQWETLADFTNDPNMAIDIYKQALNLAKKLHRVDYLASTKLALAENYLELGDFDKAQANAVEANDIAKDLPNLVLRREISEFLLMLSNVEAELEELVVSATT